MSQPAPAETGRTDGDEQTQQQQQEAIDAAAAAARREAEAKTDVLNEENARLQAQLEQAKSEGAPDPAQATPPPPPDILDYDQLSDPKAVQEHIARQAEAKAKAMVDELRQELTTKDTETQQEKIAAGIRSEFPIFGDKEYKEEAEDKLSALLGRHEGDYTKEVYREKADEAAKFAERLKAKEVNAQADATTAAGEVTPPPPAGGSAEAMAVSTKSKEFDGLDSDQRKAKIREKIESGNWRPQG